MRGKPRVNQTAFLYSKSYLINKELKIQIDRSRNIKSILETKQKQKQKQKQKPKNNNSNENKNKNKNKNPKTITETKTKTKTRTKKEILNQFGNKTDVNFQ